MKPSKRKRLTEGHAAPRSIFQYIDILRDRWFSALLAFLVVASFVGVHALFSEPSYESQAMIQIDMQSASNDALAEVTLANSQANIDAELEVMRSYSVAAEAAVIAGAGVVIGEENGYRPWESLVRSVRNGGEPTRLSASIAERPMPLQAGSYRLTFDLEGKQFQVQDQRSQESLGSFAWHAKEGAELKLVGESVHLAPLAGSPAGRTFLLQIRPAGSAASWLRSRATAVQVGVWTGMVNIGALADDPYLAQILAGALAKSYIQQKKARKDDQIRKRITWLEQQIRRETKVLDKALDDRDDYVTEHGAILLGQKATAAFEAQSALFAQRLEQQQILMQEKATLDALRSTKSPDRVMAAIGSANTDTQTQVIADSLVQLEVERGTLLRTGSKEEDPPVKRLDARIGELRHMFDRLTADLRDEVVAQILRRIDAVNSRIAQIKGEVEKHEKVLDALPMEERALATLTRDVEAAQKRYVFLERMKGESELALSSTMTQAHQIDPALLNTGRRSPVLFRRTLVAIFLGLFAAVGVALLRHIRDRTVQSPGDLEEGLGLQLFAAIPSFSSVPRRQRRNLQSSLVVRDIPTSTLAENYRTLRANIRFADTGKPIQALTITSALPKEGKTVTTLNLALSMAKAGNSVVVVDADLRRPMVDTRLEGQRTPGVVEVLLGELSWREALQSFEQDGLSFIPAGRSLRDPSTLLEGGRFEQMLAELRDEFEYILFDVPPVLAVSDAAAFFRSLDAVFLVSRQGACPADIVAGAREQVERFGGKLLGAIFNGFDAKRAGSRRYGYAGYYGYYGYYGKYGYNKQDADEPGSDRGATSEPTVESVPPASERGAAGSKG